MTAAAIRIGIIDHTDAPGAKCLAIVVGEPGANRVEYLDRRQRRLKGQNFGLDRWTDVGTFGVEISLVMHGVLRVQQVGLSRAVYWDGQSRRWQDRGQVEISLRQPLIRHVVRYLGQPRAVDATTPSAPRDERVRPEIAR